MKCIIRECDKEADLPFFACSQEHGFIWKSISRAIKENKPMYLTYYGAKELSKEDIEFYKPLIK